MAPGTVPLRNPKGTSRKACLEKPEFSPQVRLKIDVDREEKSIQRPVLGNQPAPYRGLSGPPGPKCRKSLENLSQGLRPGTPKKSPKSPEKVQKHSPDTFGRLSPGLFGDFFGSPDRRPRETFSRLFRHFGPEGPERPL